MNYIKEKLRQLGEYFNHKGIQFVIAASFTLVAILGMGFIGVFLYQGYGSAAEDMVLSNSKQVIDQVEINLNTYLRNMMRISDAVYYNVIKNTDLDEESMSQEMNLLYEVYRDNLVGLACFTDTGELISSVPMGNLKENVDVTKQSWFVDAQDKMENLHFSDLHVQNIFENSTNRYYWVISLSRGVELTNSGKMSEGILLVDMDFSGIRQLFAKVNSQNMGYVYLMDSDGKIIYHPRQNLIFSNMIQENNEIAKTYEDGAHRETFEGEDRMVAVKTVGYTGWKIVSVMPMEKFLGDFSRTRTMAVMIIIVAILVMIFANQFVAVRVAKPLRNLEDSLTGIGMDREPQIYIGVTSGNPASGRDDPLYGRAAPSAHR